MTGDITVRRATLDDDAALQRIDRETWAPDNAVARAPGPDDVFFARSGPDGVLLACDDAEVIGYVKLRPATGVPSNAHVMAIHGLAVRPAARGRRVARRLLNSAEDAARSAGATRLSLRVLGSNAGARALYAKQGYRIIGMYPGEFLLPRGDGGAVVPTDDVLMVKDLHDGAPGAALPILEASYDAVRSFVSTVDDARSWVASGCEGWAVRDLIWHCGMDTQRALVALHTVVAEPCDRDAVTYWSDWPGRAGAVNARRFVRVVASMYADTAQLTEEYLESCAAVLDAARRTGEAVHVATRGHVLTAGDLMRTLAVEATLHQLDLVRDLPDAPGPSVDGLAELRLTLDGLLAHPVSTEMGDVRYALIAIGRDEPTALEETMLGEHVSRLPLLA
jgi:ribosomal protein S18 acetylase RimI-like enzyme